MVTGGAHLPWAHPIRSITLEEKPVSRYGIMRTAMLWAFGDESHDSTKERIFTVAGLLGDESQWASFRQAWKARLGGAVFHAADCDSGYRDFRGMPENDRHRLHRDLTRLTAASGLIGYGHVIDLAGCR